MIRQLNYHERIALHAARRQIVALNERIADAWERCIDPCGAEARALQREAEALLWLITHTNGEGTIH